MMDISLQSAMERTKRKNITEESDAMVTILQTLSARHNGELWDEEDPKNCVKHSTPPRQTSLGNRRVL